jgi:hypothetical protein
MLLVQSTIGGNGNSAVSSASPNTTTSAAGFSSTTTAGSLLVCVAWYNQTSIAPNLVSSSTLTVSTLGGNTWAVSPNISSSWTASNNRSDGGTRLFFIANAPSISAGSTMTANAFYSGVGVLANATQNAEFALFEFSGIALSSPVDASRFVVSGTTVGNGNLTTTNTDLIITISQFDPGSNLTAGTGFTLGPNATVASVGQVQYQLNVAAGTTACNFNGTATSGQWCAATVAFKAPAVVASNSYGFFFG